MNLKYYLILLINGCILATALAQLTPRLPNVLQLDDEDVEVEEYIFEEDYEQIPWIPSPDVPWDECASWLASTQVTQERAASIFRVALDLVSRKPSETRRSTPNDQIASNIIRMLTGLDLHELEYTEQITDSEVGGWRKKTKYEKDDPDFEVEVDEGRGKTRVVKTSTMKLILGWIDRKEKTDKSIRAMYKWFRRDRHEPRFRNILAGNGSPLTKMQLINEHVLHQARLAREEKRVLRGWMLTAWAMQKAREMDADFFQASRTWLYKFCKRNRLASRKVTERLSRAKKAQLQAIEASKTKFREDFREARVSGDIDRGSIWNFDQSGFEYEFTSDRTLSWVGEQFTVVSVDQENKVTHSYTIQPIVSRDGRVIGKLLICLQEKGNNFGPRVAGQVEALEQELGNIVVISSTSGKMTNNLMTEWTTRVLQPAVLGHLIEETGVTTLSPPTAGHSVGGGGTVSNNTMNDSGYICENEERGESRNSPILLLGDSWAGNTNRDHLIRLDAIDVDFLQIPRHTTATMQPLDVAFFRQYKYFIKRIFYQLNIENRAQLATERAGVLRMHSVVWNQFASPLYRNLIRSGWRNVDPVRQEVRDNVLTTEKLQFRFNPSHRCQVDNCTNYAFVQCAHCGKLLCLDHFLNRTCYHEAGPEAGSSSGQQQQHSGDTDDDIDGLSDEELA